MAWKEKICLHKKAIIFAAGCLILIVGIILGFCVKHGGDIQEGTVKLYQNESEVPSEAFDGFEVFANTNLILQDGKVNLMGQNIETNDDPCQILITVNENGEDKEIYQSDILNPGYSIETAEIKKSLKPGQYDCKIIFHVLADANANSIKNVITLEGRLTNNDE